MIRRPDVDWKPAGNEGVNVLLGAPPRSQADLSFRLFGFPIRVTPWFWLAAMLLGWSGTRDGNPHLLVTWIVAVFASILIHELGHAFAFRYFGIRAHVVLYHFGGIAIPESAYAGSWSGRARNRFEPIIIAVAGPAAQLSTAAVLILGLLLAGKAVPLDGIVGEWLVQLALRWDLAFDRQLGPDAMDRFLYFFLYVSIYWALLNLLPIYPLDGGQVSREMFLLWDPNDALRHSLILSIVAGGCAAVWGFSTENTYLGILFGMLAYSSYSTLQAYSGRGDYGNPW
jgi:stage IV sporulation protein FB